MPTPELTLAREPSGSGGELVRALRQLSSHPIKAEAARRSASKLTRSAAALGLKADRELGLPAGT